MKSKNSIYMYTLLLILAGTLSGMIIVLNLLKKKNEKVEKFRSYYNMLNQWLIIKDGGKSLEKYFIDNNYNTIAIYGMGEMGKRLCEELKNTGITIKYGIDESVIGYNGDIEIVNLEDNLQEVDAVVVTAVFAFDEAKSKVSEHLQCPIIPLDDVIFEI